MNQAFLLNRMKELNLSLTVSIQQPLANTINGILKVLKGSLVADKSLNSTFIKSLGFNIDLFMLSCTFSGQICNSSLFTYFFDYQYGNCYTFNKANSSKKHKRSNRRGILNGLQLELFTGFESIKTLIFN